MNQHNRPQYPVAQARTWWLNFTAALVAITGLVTISSILLSLVHFRRPVIVSTDAHLTLLAGLTLIYLATLINRGKRSAWIISLPVYVYLIIRNAEHYLINPPRGVYHLLPAILNLALPTITLMALLINRRSFNVRSEIRSFTTALQRSLIVLLVALVYGVSGFVLLDDRDFHQEITPKAAVHYTIDRFGLTTPKQITAYNKQAHIFDDSLAVISVGAVFYTVLGLFSPIRFRLGHHQQDLEDFKKLLNKYASSSDDFFMLWPPDKSYFFNQNRTSAVAYKAAKGVALIVGDPLGPDNQIRQLLVEFMGFCRINDWQPALIHAESKYLEDYKALGFETQKIGEEAIVRIDNFINKVAASKDFRHIANKFEKLGYACQVLSPPHSPETLQRLRAISDDWLQAPGRAERGFMLGYFSSDYIQQSRIIAACDASGEIRAFINQVPSPKASEANFDFLRHGRGSPGNINDYLMLNFIKLLHEEGVASLNTGLSALAGLDDADASESPLLNKLLQLVYANGNRFFSFQGLKRFKSKYEPQWEDRYIVYRGGLRGFSKTINSLIAAMRVPRHLR